MGLIIPGAARLRVVTYEDQPNNWPRNLFNSGNVLCALNNIFENRIKTKTKVFVYCYMFLWCLTPFSIILQLHHGVS